MHRPAVLLAALAALALLIAGCARPADDGLLAARADLDGATYVVAGGTSTDLRLLCQITIAAVEAAGAEPVDECGKVGAVDVRESATQTDVDTGWDRLDRLDRDGDLLPDPAGPPDAVRAADAALGVSWLAPTAYSDTDVVVVRPGPGAPTRLPDLVAASHRVPTTLCVPTDPENADSSAETGPDTAGVLTARGFGPGTTVVTIDVNAVLAGVATGRCTAGVVPGSSGRVPALGLAVLPDDRDARSGGTDAHGGYVPLLRTSTLRADPAVADVLAEVTGRLDGPALRTMMREIEVDGRDPREAARRWLATEGLIGPR